MRLHILSNATTLRFRSRGSLLVFFFASPFWFLNTLDRLLACCAKQFRLLGVYSVCSQCLRPRPYGAACNVGRCC